MRVDLTLINIDVPEGLRSLRGKMMREHDPRSATQEMKKAMHVRRGYED